MFPRVLVEVGVIYPPLLRIVSLPIGAMLLVSLGLVLYLWRGRRADEQEDREEMKVSNPLRLSTAITFALVFSVVLIVVRAANEFFGDAGVYVASALAGLTDVDAITLSVSELASYGQLHPQVAGMAVVLATLVNTAAKAVMVWFLGAPELRCTVMRAFGLVLLTGIVGSAIVLVIGF